MRALQRAVALAQMNDPALAVADDLDLDVARPLEVALEIDVAASEERRRLVLGARHRASELVVRGRARHAAAAAAGRGWDQDRLADGAGRGLGRCEIAYGT